MAATTGRPPAGGGPNPSDVGRSRNKVLVVGEVLVDLAAEPGTEGAQLRLIAYPGGSPANVAVALARLDVSASFAGRISAAGFGPWLHSHLRANRVDTSPSVTAAENASLALVTFDAARVPSYTFYVEGTADWQWHPSELDRVPLTDVRAVHTGSLAVALEPGRAILEAWLSTVRAVGQVFISFDPNVRPTLIDHLSGFRERTSKLVTLAHLVKVSEQDLHELHPAEEPLTVAAQWARSGPDIVVVTHGPAGATALQAGRARPGEHPSADSVLALRVVHRPAPPVAVVDTVGAGDAFMAGLLTWLAERGALAVGAAADLDAADVADWLDFANQVAALTCTRAGADPPRRSDLSGTSASD
jgi:fructokinase